MGREVESMYGDIGRWMTSCETVNKEVKKVIQTDGMSVEEEDHLKSWTHKKKIQTNGTRTQNFC